MLERKLPPHEMEIFCVFSAELDHGAPPPLRIRGCTFWEQSNCPVSHCHYSEDSAIGAAIGNVHVAQQHHRVADATRIDESADGEKRTPDTGDFRSARLGGRTTETQAANTVANGFAFTLP